MWASGSLRVLALLEKRKHAVAQRIARKQAVTAAAAASAQPKSVCGQSGVRLYDQPGSALGLSASYYHRRSTLTSSPHVTSAPHTTFIHSFIHSFNHATTLVTRSIPY